MDSGRQHHFVWQKLDLSEAEGHALAVGKFAEPLPRVQGVFIWVGKDAGQGVPDQVLFGEQSAYGKLCANREAAIGVKNDSLAILKANELTNVETLRISAAGAHGEVANRANCDRARRVDGLAHLTRRSVCLRGTVNHQEPDPSGSQRRAFWAE